MATISKGTFDFLKELKAKNDREWFTANKTKYEKAKAEFEVFIDALIARIARFDPNIAHHKAKDCIFRIYRDVRFSQDKSPYKVHFGAHVSPAVKKSDIHSRAGYYIHLEPGGSFLAGGAYLPQGDWLKAIRQEIAYNPEEFKGILKAPSFKKYFKEMEGEQLKTAPRDYPKDHPEIELLKYKSFLASHYCDDKHVLSTDFLDHCEKVFEALYPFDHFLNKSTD